MFPKVLSLRGQSQYCSSRTSSHSAEVDRQPRDIRDVGNHDWERVHPWSKHPHLVDYD